MIDKELEEAKLARAHAIKDIVASVCEVVKQWIILDAGNFKGSVITIKKPATDSRNWNVTILGYEIPSKETEIESSKLLRILGVERISALEQVANEVGLIELELRHNSADEYRKLQNPNEVREPLTTNRQKIINYLTAYFTTLIEKADRAIKTDYIEVRARGNYAYEKDERVGGAFKLYINGSYCTDNTSDHDFNKVTIRNVLSKQSDEILDWLYGCYRIDTTTPPNLNHHKVAGFSLRFNQVLGEQLSTNYLDDVETIKNAITVKLASRMSGLFESWLGLQLGSYAGACVSFLYESGKGWEVRLWGRTIGHYNNVLNNTDLILTIGSAHISKLNQLHAQLDMIEYRLAENTLEAYTKLYDKMKS